MDWIKKWRIFIEKYYYDELLDRVKKGEKSLIIDHAKIKRSDLELAEEILKNPEEIVKKGEKSLEDFDLDVEEPIKIRVENLPKSQHILVNEIRSKHLGHLLSTTGLIRQTSDVRPRITVAEFECLNPNCGNTIAVEQRESKITMPPRCGACGRKTTFKLVNKKLVDMQRIVLEESPESLLGGEQPKRIPVFLSEDLLDPKLERRRYPGNKVEVVGVVKEVPVHVKSGAKSTTYDLIIDTNYINTVEEEFEEIKISKEDEKEIEELAKDKELYKKLLNSVAPSIYGYDDIKEAIVLQLFGGVQKTRADGSKTRGDVHIFLVGDPGAGKSEILRSVSELAPKARYIAGKGATGAGLTATVVRDEFISGWTLEAGALVLANHGIVCIDEMDKMSAEDRSAMHEALEQQVISISKATIQATLRAQTSVLGAANPKFGRFDPYSPVASQIDLPPTLINRFDLIFTIRDIPDSEVDKKVATHLLELHRKPKSKKPEIDTKFFRKYIAYAKKHHQPTLTASALEEIKGFYVDLRSRAATEAGEVTSVPISARQLEALIRLSEASAKARLSKKVTKEDAERAIRLLHTCMKEVAVDTETGRFDIDKIAVGITSTQRSRITIVRRAIEELTEKLGKIIPIMDVLERVEEDGIDRTKAEEILEELKKKGDIFEPKPGVIQKVG
ncbi:MAG: minichromosome maintenance protein MCM [Candidatus Woesearchaeota archaeon]|nr:MAG: minichromosome maintenance protein MCM [Candidatus Woesearchaeota archaeon]